MKHFFFSLFLLASCAIGSSAQNDITFQVNMCQLIAAGTFDPGANAVFLAGGGGPSAATIGAMYMECGTALTDDDGDGVYETTRSYPTGYEIHYKFQIGIPSDAGTALCTEGWEPNLPADECAINEFGDRGYTVTGPATLPEVCFGSCEACSDCDAIVQSMVPFCVDMNCADTTERPPAVTGPSFGWCEGCNPMTDPDGDDIWCIALSLQEGTLFEYKYQANGWTAQEELLDDVLAGGTCAPVNDSGAGFANRQITIAPGLVVNDTYGSCDGCNDPVVPTVDVPFCVDMNCADTTERPPAVTGPLWAWCEGCQPMTDPDGDDIWCITITLDEGAEVEYKYQANGWTAQEDLVDDMIAGGSCAPIWDPMGDPEPFANRQFTATAGTSINDTYGSCDACPTGTADCQGVVGGAALPGTACDDGNPATSDDVYLADCSCAGTAAPDCAGVPGGPNTVDSCGVCDADPANDNSTCTDCAGTPNGTSTLDDCGVCDADSTNDNSTCSDCAGVPNGTNMMDQCGVCDADPTNDNTTCLDCAGLINGPNMMDLCGVCDNDPTNDNSTCSDCAGVPNGSSIVDCANVCGGTAALDQCGDCVGGNTGATACVADCAGTLGGTAQPDCNGDCNGTAVVDGCGVCAGGNTGVTACSQDCNGVAGGTSVTDCNGDCDGTATTDACGTCVGGNTGLVACVTDCAGNAGGTAVEDCNGDCNGTAMMDNCGTCAGGNTGVTACATDCAGVAGGSAVLDCNGDCNGTATTDDCGNCVGGNSGEVACAADCAGVAGGSAFTDECGNCVGGTTGAQACVLAVDCAGVTDGTAFTDECNNCVGGTTGVEACVVAAPDDCAGVSGGTAVTDACGNCVGGTTGAVACVLAPDCANVAGGTAFTDECGDCVGGTTGMTACTTLSIQLGKFSAVANGTFNQLEWTTYAEFENEIFIIERSEDGTTYEAIGQVEGAGTTTHSSDYSFRDHNIQAEYYYYRLRYVDAAGLTEYSNAVGVGRDNASIISVYPTIVGNEVVINSLTRIDFIRIYNTAAKEIYLAKDLTNGTHTIPFGNELKGLYFATIKSGAEMQTFKLIKE